MNNIAIELEALKLMFSNASAEPIKLSYGLLSYVTVNFSNTIGRGGFGVVYEGDLGNGKVAVKKLSNTHDFSDKLFLDEIKCLIRTKHKNIVRFLGYCSDTQGELAKFDGAVVLSEVQERLLCFEYVPNGNIQRYLKEKPCGDDDWHIRYRMIKGICVGLRYLHEERIGHLDMKPENIMLDFHMEAKITDFGLSRLLDVGKSMILTTNIRGTMGYIAPETITRGELSFKSDVYALGIIVIKLLTGCNDIDFDNWHESIDIDCPHMKSCMEIARACVDFDKDKRPTTSEIVHRLNKMNQEPQSASPAIKDYGNVYLKLRKSSAQKQLEPSADKQLDDVDALIEYVAKNLGYREGKPIAAFTIYKRFLRWKCFDAEKTSVFDRLSQLIGSAVENEEDNDNLAYWLSNTSTLLFLLKTAGVPGSVSRKKPPEPTSLTGRMDQGQRSESFANMHVGAKYPALLFKQQLTACVEKIYGTIRDNIKKELSSSISLCILAPRAMRASKLRISGQSSGQPQSNHWQKIIKNLDVVLKILQDNHVPTVLHQKLFTQIFSYINVQLFNSLLLRRECCSFSNGEYVKAGLAELELWCAKATAEYVAASWDEIRHTRQAVGFLVIRDKFRMSYDEIVHDPCPILSVKQLYRICIQYWDDKYNTKSVSSDVLGNMRVLIMKTDSDNAESSSFLLDDNSSIPFSVEDITDSIQTKYFCQLLENPAF